MIMWVVDVCVNDFWWNLGFFFEVYLWLWYCVRVFKFEFLVNLCEYVDLFLDNFNCEGSVLYFIFIDYLFYYVM